MANKSVLELAVETGRWDSGLKKAKSALDKFTDSSGGLQKALDADSEKMSKFVQMMGKAESTAKTGKGQMNDYKQAIEQLTMQFNRMTDAQKKTVGQDYLKAIDQLKEKYRGVSEEIQEMNRTLTQASSSGGGGGGLFSGLGDKMTGMMQVFGGNLLAQGVANLTSELVGSVQQSIELAREGEGVRIAFERLNRPGLLDNLKEATHGTVSEVELMKQAIKFENFKLPVEDLATYLGFAQQKAKDTGESIDYLVNSIVTGLGRQSKQILDNLGISAAELTKRMNEGATMTQAVADIIREEMAKAGDYVETAADRAARATAKATDEAEAFGREAMPIAQEWEETWAVLKSGAMSFAQTLLGPVAKSLQTIRSLEQGIDWDKITSSSNNINSPNFNFGGVNNTPVWQNQTVHAPGGYVEVTDANTGAVIGGRHFDNLSDANAIKDWRKSLHKTPRTKSGRNTPPKKTDLEKLLDKTSKYNSNFSIFNQAFNEEIEIPGKVSLKNQTPEDLKKELDQFAPKDPYELPVKFKYAETKEFLKKEEEKKLKGIMTSAQMAAEAVSNIGAAFASIEDPSAKAAGMVMQAIASIALGFATASTNANTAGTGWGWLAWLAAGAAAMATTISTIHSLTGFETGGEVKGNSYSGDNIPIMANAGEVVLTRAMAGNIASQLQGSGSNVHVTGELRGESIYLAVNRSLKRKGKGELVTWK